MKDEDARSVINLMNSRIWELQKVLFMTLKQYPHKQDCKCPFCDEYTSEQFAIHLAEGNPLKGERTGYEWFMDDGK
jgi:hypothetical protein